MTSNFSHDHIAYNGQRVTFTCRITNSEILEWTSNEYIGTGGDRLQFLRIDPIGTIIKTSPTTVATLINSYTENRVTVMVSELHIIVSAHYAMSTVTCGNNGEGPHETINFQTVGKVHNDNIIII